jgi:hypothetical protein
MKEKLIRFDDGIIETYKQAIDRGRFIKSEIKDVPAIEYNRVKYNRMDWKEQQIYEQRLKDTKLEYRLFISDNIYYKVNKTLVLYFENWKENKDMKDYPDTYCSNEQLNHLFNKEVISC